MLPRVGRFLHFIAILGTAVGAMVFFLPPAAPAQTATAPTAQEKPRMAVLGFESSTDGRVEAEAIAEEIGKVFVQSGKFTVIDRTLTTKIAEEWALQQSGMTDREKAVKVGKIYNVSAIVTGKLLKFPGGGWQVSGVMLDAQTGVRQKSETIRHKGDFFSLLDGKVPGLARALAGLAALPPEKQAAPPSAPSAPAVGPPSPGAGLAETYWKRSCSPCDYTRKKAASTPMLLHLHQDGTFSYQNPNWKKEWVDSSKNTWKVDGWKLVISWADGRAVGEYEPTNATQTQFRGVPRVPDGTSVKFTLEKMRPPRMR